MGVKAVNKKDLQTKAEINRMIKTVEDRDARLRKADKQPDGLKKFQSAESKPEKS
jgi:hypothetical protein